jgi:hypothetical protein
VSQTMTHIEAIAAQTVVENALSGKLAEFVDRPSMVEMAITGGGDSVFATLTIGRTIVIDAQELNPATSFPILPDNLFAQAPALPTERIKLRLENRHASTARTVQVQIGITPVA